MAAIKSIICIFAILFSLSVVLAEEATTASNNTNERSFFGFPSIPGLPNFGSGFPSFPGLGNFTSGFPSIPGLGNFSSGFPSIPGVPSLPNFPRQRRQADSSDAPVEEASTPVNEHDPSHEHNERLFFTLFPTVTGCNYTATPGRFCASCTQALTCLPSNVGLRQRCRGLFQYCNNGRCSLNRGPACDATTSTSTSSTSSSSSTTSTTTTTTTTTVAPGK